MKSRFLYACVLIAAMLSMALNGCKGSGQSLQEERDSLMFRTMEQDLSISDYKNLVELINQTLDSIDYQEANIFVSDGELPVTRDEVVFNLTRFENLVKRQQQRIDDLEKALRESNRKNDDALAMIEHFKQQIAVKDAQITQLRQQVEDQRLSIDELRTRIEAQQGIINQQTTQINTLQTQNERMNTALARQDEMLSQAYFIIGTKDDLQRKGIVKKGKMVPESALDRTRFVQVDIRTWTSFTFSARKPRILTPMPAGSYTLTTDGQRKFTLTITNPTDFWSVSNFLVIQTD